MRDTGNAAGIPLYSQSGQQWPAQGFVFFFNSLYFMEIVVLISALDIKIRPQNFQSILPYILIYQQQGMYLKIRFKLDKVVFDHDAVSINLAVIFKGFR